MTEYPRPPTTGFQPTFTFRKDAIPIRSLSYKKSLKDPKDQDDRKEMLKTMSRFSTPQGTGIIKIPSTKAETSPTREMTVPSLHTREMTREEELNADIKVRPATTKTVSFTMFGRHDNNDIQKSLQLQNPNPNLSVHLHRLSIGRKSETKRDSVMPEIKKSFSSKPPTSYSKGRKTKGSQPPSLAPDDYFNLLYDPSRGRFQHEEFEGTFDYYSDDVIKSRIMNMGFRDPEYFGRRTGFTNIDVHDENTIREEYEFKLPVVVSTMENEATLVSHMLGGTYNNIKHIESEIVTSKQKIQDLVKEKEEHRQAMEKMKKAFEAEIAQIYTEFRAKIHLRSEELKDDFVKNQNEYFKLQKEITWTQRLKIQIEKEIDASISRLDVLEKGVYGVNMFDLDTNNRELNNISVMNLRPELSSSMKNKLILH